jgi:hypothetical protein
MTDKRASSTTARIAIALYCLVGGGFLLQGARYLSADVLMDYHLAVLGVPWASLDDNYQVLLLGLLRGFGAGSFCMGLVVILLAMGPLRSGATWARWLTPITAGAYVGLLYSVTSSALLPGAQPIAITAVLFGLVCLAVLCSWLDRSQESAAERFT